MLDDTTWTALEAWLAHSDAAGCLNCLASGSVLLPRLAPGHNPANPGEDSIAWAPQDRARLLTLVSRAAANVAPRRFLLLSGDYHLRASMGICVGGRKLGAAVVAPPLYAPMAYVNAMPAALWTREDLQAFDMTPYDASDD